MFDSMNPKRSLRLTRGAKSNGDALDRQAEQAAELYSSRSLERLGVCIADELIARRQLEGSYEERKRRVEVALAASPDRSEVHRAFLASALAYYPELGHESVLAAAGECPLLARALTSYERDPSLIRTADFGIAQDHPPTLSWEVFENQVNKSPVLGMFEELCLWFLELDRLSYVVEGTGFGTSERWVSHQKGVWQATRAIVALYGEAGLREILACKSVHAAIERYAPARE